MTPAYNQELEKIIAEKRQEWLENVKSLAPLMRTAPEHMTDAQALAISYRSILLDELGYFYNLFSRHDKELKELKRDKFIYYATGLLPDGTRPKAAAHPLLGRKMTKTEYDTVISGDLREQEYTLQIVNDMVDFLKETIRSIDQTLYAVKNRIELFNYLK